MQCSEIRDQSKNSIILEMKKCAKMGLSTMVIQYVWYLILRPVLLTSHTL